MNFFLLILLLALSASTVVCKQCYLCQGIEECNLNNRLWDVVECDGGDDHLGLPQILEPDNRNHFCFSSWRDSKLNIELTEHYQRL